MSASPPTIRRRRLPRAPPGDGEPPPGEPLLALYHSRRCPATIAALASFVVGSTPIVSIHPPTERLLRHRAAALA